MADDTCDHKERLEVMVRFFTDAIRCLDNTRVRLSKLEQSARVAVEFVDDEEARDALRRVLSDG